MLQFINKYNLTNYNKRLANINFKKNKHIKYRILFLHIKSVICGTSIFMRRSYFRSLLIYTNLQYANLNLEADNNIFTHAKATHTYLHTKHPSFLPKKRYIK